jgi:hypothetical protein
MERLARLFVGQPFNFLWIGLAFLGAYLARRATHGALASRALLVAGALWGLAFLWELAVLGFSPDADIRVDLLVIAPVLLGVTLWALFRGWH